MQALASAKLMCVCVLPVRSGLPQCPCCTYFVFFKVAYVQWGRIHSCCHQDQGIDSSFHSLSQCLFGDKNTENLSNRLACMFLKVLFGLDCSTGNAPTPTKGAYTEKGCGTSPDVPQPAMIKYTHFMCFSFSIDSSIFFIPRFFVRRIQTAVGFRAGSPPPGLLSVGLSGLLPRH